VSRRYPSFMTASREENDATEDQTFWHDRWQAGEIGFHREQVHPDLVAHEASFFGNQPRRVLVPLCGKSLDLAWLAGRGHQVVGVELVELAVEQFFAEQRLTPAVERAESITRYTCHGLTILCGDFFELTRAAVGDIDRVWDRGALVAIRSARRAAYVAHLRGLVRGDWKLLQNAFCYDQSRMEGPPWSVPEAELLDLYDGCRIDVLDTRDIISGAPRWRERGLHSFVVSTYLVSGGGGGE